MANNPGSTDNSFSAQSLHWKVQEVTPSIFVIHARNRCFRSTGGQNSVPQFNRIFRSSPQSRRKYTSFMFSAWMVLAQTIVAQFFNFNYSLRGIRLSHVKIILQGDSQMIYNTSGIVRSSGLLIPIIMAGFINMRIFMKKGQTKWTPPNNRPY